MLSTNVKTGMLFKEGNVKCEINHPTICHMLHIGFFFYMTDSSFIVVAGESDFKVYLPGRNPAQVSSG